MLNTSFSARHNKGNRNGRLSDLGKVSGRRAHSQTIKITANTTKAAKMPRQFEKLTITAPMAGAKAGTITKIIITKDMILAI